MKIIVPDYYFDFKCIADKCNHSCCRGWEVDIDEESLDRFKAFNDIWEKISFEGDPHFVLDENEKCPFLNKDNLCDIILKHGEDMICQICTDHPRFRNYWADRCEMGIGLVCEEAARIVLSREKPMTLIELDTGRRAALFGEYLKAVYVDENDQAADANEPDADEMAADELDEDEVAADDAEAWLYDLRDGMLSQITGNSPIDRLREYLIFRHIPDALYDDRLEERIAFVDFLCDEIKKKWAETDGGLNELIEIVRLFSYDYEYDEEVKEQLISQM